MAPKTKKSKPQVVEVSSDLFLRVINPDLLFDVQKAFQAKGITFVDLNSGRLIKGHVNLDTIGMVRHVPTPPVPHRFGYPTKHELPPPVPKPDQFVTNVEATLNIYEPKDDKDPIVFTVRVVDDKDLNDWIKITAEVGTKFLIQDEFKNILPEAVFQIVPLAKLDETDPDSAKRVMLGEIQRFCLDSGRTHAVSNEPIFIEDDWDDE